MDVYGIHSGEIIEEDETIYLNVIIIIVLLFLQSHKIHFHSDKVQP